MNEFQKLMDKRMELGALKYGQFTYLKKTPDKILKEAQEEVVDLANYSMQTWERIQLLREKLKEVKE